MSTNTHAVELITVGNAAKILGVTTTTLRNWDKNGKLKSFSNCKCMNDKGECKVCYPEIKKDQKNASVIYNPNDYNKDTQ